jgi:hypothetical protein
VSGCNFFGTGFPFRRSSKSKPLSTARRSRSSAVRGRLPISSQISRSGASERAKLVSVTDCERDGKAEDRADFASGSMYTQQEKGTGDILTKRKGGRSTRSAIRVGPASSLQLAGDRGHTKHARGKRLVRQELTFFPDPSSTTPDTDKRASARRQWVRRGCEG